MRPFVTLSAFLLPFALFTFACGSAAPDGGELTVDENVVDAGAIDGDEDAEAKATPAPAVDGVGDPTAPVSSLSHDPPRPDITASRIPAH